MRRLFLDASGALAHEPDTRGQILRQMRAFALAHFHQCGQRLLQRLFDDRPDVFRVHQLFIRLENARGADDLIQRYFAGQFQLPRQPRQFRRVSFGEGQIDVGARRRFAVGGVEGDARRDAPARDPGVDGVADWRFEHFQFARQVHGNFRLPAVHRAEFHGDFEAVPRALTAPVTRHGFHPA